MFTRIVGFFNFVWFGFLAVVAWGYLHTSPRIWWTFYAAVLFTILSGVGLWLLVAGDPEDKERKNA